ncbi:hypothetical protein TNCT_181471 [Trichonephila clavata]|uniref:Uncharacterized protein n=1 Tax=Trichonephila clavata TaxID=2740835 RepID=A0A8X6I9K8_TRICU|nr:hypothetical protein TNCT_181471 [Trichonephila clavata]
MGGTKRQHVSDVRVFPPLDIVFSWQRRSQCSIGAEPGSVKNVYARTEEKEHLNSIRFLFSFFTEKKSLQKRAQILNTSLGSSTEGIFINDRITIIRFLVLRAPKLRNDTKSMNRACAIASQPHLLSRW